MELEPGLHGDSEMLDMPEPWTFSKESSRELSWQGQLSSMALVVELQDLDFAVFSVHLAFTHCFFAMPLFLSFGMVIDILCHCVLKVCNMLFDYILTSGHCKEIALVSEET